MGESEYNTLTHFGIKGMKWGKRKAGNDGQVVSSNDSAVSDKHRETIRSTGSTKSLSNAELRQVVERMELERRFTNAEAQSSQASAGRKFIMDIVIQVGKQQASAYLNKQIASALAKH